MPFLATAISLKIESHFFNSGIDTASMIGPFFQTKIMILSNDDGHGVLVMERSEILVSEDYKGMFVTVVRKKGLFGQVRFFLIYIIYSIR